MSRHVSSDFPIDWEEDQYVSRREFFKFMTLSSGALALASGGLAIWASTPRDRRTFERTLVAPAGQLGIGDVLHFAYPGPEDQCMLIRTGAATYVAYSSRCTHLSCPVEWRPQENRIYCPCHNGAFAVADGRVLQGPPPRPLPKVLLEVRDGGIYAIGVAGADS